MHHGLFSFVDAAEKRRQHSHAMFTERRSFRTSCSASLNRPSFASTTMRSNTKGFSAIAWNTAAGSYSALVSRNCMISLRASLHGAGVSSTRSTTRSTPACSAAASSRLIRFSTYSVFSAASSTWCITTRYRMYFSRNSLRCGSSTSCSSDSAKEAMGAVDTSLSVNSFSPSSGAFFITHGANSCSSDSASSSTRLRSSWQVRFKPSTPSSCNSPSPSLIVNAHRFSHCFHSCSASRGWFFCTKNCASASK